MAIENALRKVNFSRLKSDGMSRSFGMMGIREISTSSPFDWSFRITTSMTFDISFLTACLVPLRNIDGLMIRKITIGAPILSDIRSKKFKSSI